MKTCFKCRKSLPLSEFYRHPRMDDGHLNKCKACTKKDVKKNRDENVERYRAYDRTRGKRPSKVDFRKKNKGVGRAYSRVSRAIRDGIIPKLPCEVCASPDALAHHDDYDKPLKVTWLCQVHHKARHKMLREAGRDPVQMLKK